MSLSETDRPTITSPRSQLAGAIEFYLCGVFQYKNSVPSGRWWCDGAFGLSITELSPIAFQIVGTAYWADAGLRSSPFYLAPFELEFCFQSQNDIETQRIIIRFGALDESGEIDRVPHDANAIRLFKNRPRTNAEWAFAIELA